ncbi:MAG: hypothetical protein WB424_04485 [Terracidiphilus sp.]
MSETMVSKDFWRPESGVPSGEMKVLRRIVRRVETTVERREIALAQGAMVEAGICRYCGQSLPCATENELKIAFARRLNALSN